MKPYVWSPDRTPEEAKKGAYWERNMLASMLARVLLLNAPHDSPAKINGWYKHVGDGFEGWSRVISIWNGKYTFHVPDDFDLGDLPEIIEPNWDGHTTEEKWYRAMRFCGVAALEPIESAQGDSPEAGKEKCD